MPVSSSLGRAQICSFKLHFVHWKLIKYNLHWNHYIFITPGMVQALVGQKPLKRDILRVFSMSDFIKIKGDYW